MSDHPRPRSGPLLRLDVVAALVRITAAAAALFGVVGGLAVLAWHTGPDGPGLGLVPLALVLVPPVLGAVTSVGLLAAAGVLELSLRSAAAVRRLERTIAEVTGRSTEHSRRTTELLAELRDVLLMEEPQRRDHARFRVEQDRRDRFAEVEKLVAGGELSAARSAAEELAARHPQFTEAARLLERVREEERRRRLADADRLAEEAEQAARSERWRDAFRLAEDLIARFPDTPPADFARAGLETLRRNAEIEHRRQLEEQFKELMAAKRYPEALVVAETVCSTYPDSPQALALRDSIEKLRRKADRDLGRAAG
jgi:hypothetical protein